MTASAPSGRIAYQGEPGANSDAACRERFPELEPVPCATFEDAFDAVESGRAELAMIPVENSIAGRVADIHHLLPESGLHIVGEHFMPIHFQLMACRGARLEQVTTVRSHAHALGQCRRDPARARLERRRRGRHRRRRPRGGRAGDPRGRRARAPAGRRDLRPRHPGGGHRGRAPQHHALPGPGPRAARARARRRPGRSRRFVFRVRNMPAALYKAMGGFATNGVNMTKLESYQLGGTFTATQFYAEVEGHPEDAALALALEELAFFSVHLGSSAPTRPARSARRSPNPRPTGSCAPATVRISPDDAAQSERG